MVKAHIERVIDVPLDRTWEILADFSHVQKIHPLVGKVDQVTPTRDRGVDAIRTCHLYDGNKATERIVDWNEDNHEYTIHLVDGTLPMKKVEVTLKAEAVGMTKSKLVADMKLNAKFGVLGKIMERLVIKPKLGGAIGDLFAGLEHYEKTGDEVQEGFKASTPAIVQ